ncbi:MAG: helix-turn-helix domain-containing protein [Candidatus Eremiobacteraeota bacterium]|nr:helix-turn-helix domain-containing protein [Candidatus Eremiobacteraeota bacterium]
MEFPAILHRDEDVFWIEFPDLETCVTQGENMEELTKNSKGALSCHLEAMIEAEMEIPAPSDLHGENIIYITVPPETAVSIIIRKERKNQGLSQGDVAGRMKTSYRTIQQIERAKSSPSIKTLARIAKALGKKLIIDMI